jgi:hypothetical protein
MDFDREALTELSKLETIPARLANVERHKPSACLNLPRPPVSPLCMRRPNRHPSLGLRGCVGEALTTEAITECIRSGSVGEAESNIYLLDLVLIPAAADWNAPITVERINFQ